MAARAYTEFSDMKRSYGKPPAARKGVAPEKGEVHERTADWKNAGPEWKGSFNSATQFPRVKTSAKKHGLD